MRVKIFSGYPQTVENNLGRWLSENYLDISIEKILQSSADAYIHITIFYTSEIAE